MDPLQPVVQHMNTHVLRQLSHCPPCVSVRESLYRLLPQTTPENLQKNFDLFTVDPTTRYVNVNQLYVTPAQVTCVCDFFAYVCVFLCFVVSFNKD